MIPEFNPETHEYRVNGIKKDSVTEIIGEFKKISLFGGIFYVHLSGAVISEEVMKEAQDFGKAIHKAAFYILRDKQIDWDALHPSLIPTLKQLELWKQKYEPQPVLCEQPLYSKKYDFCGTPDIIAKLKGIRNLCLIDIKTGSFITEIVGPQTAAYEVLYREYSKYRGMIKRYVLSLPKDGSEYSFIPLTRRDDFIYFLHKKYLYDYEKKIHAIAER